jgi:hypothetical protein
VEIYHPGGFEYQRTDADTYYHYKFLQNDWELWEPDVAPGSFFEVIRDYATYGEYHIMKSESDHADVTFGHPAPPNLTQVVRLAEAPLGGATTLATLGLLTAYDGADILTVGAAESFSFVAVLLFEKATNDRGLANIVSMQPGGQDTYFDIGLLWPEYFISSLTDSTTGDTLYVLWDGAAEKITRINQWHQIALIWDRSSTSLPKCFVDYEEMTPIRLTGQLPEFPALSSTVNLFSDFGALTFDGQMFVNRSGFGHSDPMRLGEVWMSKGTKVEMRQ